jgi:hypothetical protein
MPPLKNQNKVTVKDNRTPDEIAIQSAITSHYNILTPMYKAQNIRITSPLTKKDHLFSVTDTKFFEMFYELSQLGLKDKLFDELETFIVKIDPDWQSVYSDMVQYFESMDGTNEIAQDSSIS